MLCSNSCIMCKYSISDPICRNCYIKQTEILLNDLELPEMVTVIISNKLKKKVPIETLNDMGCILCKRENVSMCRYCFSIILTNILRELNFTEELINNFKYSPIYEELKPLQN